MAGAAVATAAVGDDGDELGVVDGADVVGYDRGHDVGSPYYLDADAPNDSNLRPF